MNRITTTLGCLSLLCTMSAGAQVPAGEPARFLQRYIGLTADQIEQARRGIVVTKVLASDDPEEIALFGIVAVDVPREEIVRQVRDLPKFLRTPGRTAFGLFQRPATVDDARTFVAEQSDLEAIKKCRPGQCDVKMPAADAKADDPEHALICDRSARCTVNLLWVRVRDAVTSAVDSMTLADLVPLPGTVAVTTPALTGAVTPS